MARTYLTGDKQIDRALSRLKDKSANSIAKSCLSAAMTPIRKSMRAAAPVRTGETKGSIGRRLDRSQSTKEVRAKVGVDVGKGKVKSGHAWLVALRTGFVRTGYDAARGAAHSAMQKRAREKLVKEAAKARAA